jgi:parallel beta-helix repeat protein
MTVPTYVLPNKPKLEAKMPNISLAKYVVLLTIYISFSLGALTVSAATYYVATTGNDANACATAQTITTPKRTIAAGVACLNPGDTLYLRAGTYTEQIDLMGPNKSGTAGNYITIAGYPGDTVTLRYTDSAPAMFGPIKARGNRGWFIFENLILDGVDGTNGSFWQIRDGNHDFILRNLEIKRFHLNALYLDGVSNVTIQNCRLHDQRSTLGVPGTRGYGIYLHHGTNVLVEGNDVYNNPGGGLQIYPGPITGTVIRNNRVHDNNTEADIAIGGIVVFPSGATIVGTEIYNNLIYNNGSAPTAGDAPGIRIVNNADGTKVWNNTVYGNKGLGINIQAYTGIKPTNTVLQNNIVYGNAAGEIINVGSNSVIEHNVTTNPNFMNAAGLDFTLQSSSPAIDAGVYLSKIRTDFRKVARPQGATHDIGAYEKSTSAPPAPPQGLRVQ